LSVSNQSTLVSLTRDGPVRDAPLHIACIIHEDRGAPFLAAARGPPPGRVVPPYQTPMNNPG